MVGGKGKGRGEDVSRNGAYFFENDNEETVTVNSERYVTMLEGFVGRLGIDPTALHFQQDGGTTHTARNSMAVVPEMFGTVISRFGDIAWPARSPGLTVPDFFLWGFLKDRVFRRRIMTIQEIKKKQLLTKLRLLMRTYGGACTITSRHVYNNVLI